MTAIERTAYPRFKPSLTRDELDLFYTPSEAEVAFVKNNRAEDERQQLELTILLKAFQKLGYLPQIAQVPNQIKKHIARQLNYPLSDEMEKVPRTKRSRYRIAIRMHIPGHADR
jgi:hypothetical protein